MQSFEEDISYALIQVIKEHRRQADEALKQLGLHASQEFLLFLLWEDDGLSQSQLASRLKLELPTITKSVQRMERVGLVKRRLDEQDTRISRVYLTEQGRALYEPAMKLWKDLEARTCKHMTELEQALLRRLLQQALANLSLEE
ncbi:MarR family winged helix-turn-helix transcriptional regulator [Ktedonospora formicarum]|uniref:MarR family transcriptional regulator n=1 Tax=Ktedonospora formicarum TaxID=2778364 RepID=A0A8J3MU92_9CHLR|nr:MarR family transcriptional regulator [Ktedonospora formicarum]GHO46691.1 MarR family transcriptional regulator [Ktedonospora formicarum]